MRSRARQLAPCQVFVEVAVADGVLPPKPEPMQGKGKGVRRGANRGDATIRSAEWRLPRIFTLGVVVGFFFCRASVDQNALNMVHTGVVDMLGGIF